MPTKCKEIKKKLVKLGYDVYVTPHGLYIAKGTDGVEITCSTIIGLYNAILRIRGER